MNDSNLYNAGYFMARHYSADTKRKLSYLQERNRIYKLVRSGSILDVGCGLGDFLNCFDDRWNKFGLEVSNYAWQKSAEKGINMVRDLKAITTESMDVVVFRGTLQHINTPLEDLQEATRVLKKGGWLVILATPDSDSLVYKIWGRLPALDEPRNWIVFGTRMLTNVLKRLGYKRMEILHPYFGTPYADPIRDFIMFFFSFFAGWRAFAFPGNMTEIYTQK